MTKNFFPPARSNKEPNIQIKRNVLGQLVSYSLKSDCKIDFEEAWKYLLAKISLSLCHTDWKKRSSLKSDLLKALDIQYSPADAVQDYQQCSFVLNVMAAIVTVGNFTTIEELTWKIVNTISMGCKRVDLVAGSYRKTSWKNSMRKKRGSGEEIMTKSAKSKIRDRQAFMMLQQHKSDDQHLVQVYSNSKVKDFK